MKSTVVIDQSLTEMGRSSRGPRNSGQPLTRVADRRTKGDSVMVPYRVFDEGSAKIERHVPVPQLSRDAAGLPRGRESLAAYRLAFGRSRQEELLEFLGADRTDAELAERVGRLRIDLSPPDDHAHDGDPPTHRVTGSTDQSITAGTGG